MASERIPLPGLASSSSSSPPPRKRQRRREGEQHISSSSSSHTWLTIGGIVALIVAVVGLAIQLTVVPPPVVCDKINASKLDEQAPVEAVASPTGPAGESGKSILTGPMGPMGLMGAAGPPGADGHPLAAYSRIEMTSFVAIDAGCNFLSINGDLDERPGLPGSDFLVTTVQPKNTTLLRVNETTGLVYVTPDPPYTTLEQARQHYYEVVVVIDISESLSTNLVDFTLCQSGASFLEPKQRLSVATDPSRSHVSWTTVTHAPFDDGQSQGDLFGGIHVQIETTAAASYNIIVHTHVKLIH